MFLQAEKDVDARLNLSGRKGLQSEVRDSLNSDGVLLVVQGEENMGDVLELLSWGFYREDIFPDEEHGFQEGPELDCPVFRLCVPLLLEGHTMTSLLCNRVGRDAQLLYLRAFLSRNFRRGRPHPPPLCGGGGRNGGRIFSQFC